MIVTIQVYYKLMRLDDKMSLKKRVTVQIVLQMRQFKEKNVSVHVYSTIFERENGAFGAQAE